MKRRCDGAAARPYFMVRKRKRYLACGTLDAFNEKLGVNLKQEHLLRTSFSVERNDFRSVSAANKGIMRRGPGTWRQWWVQNSARSSVAHIRHSKTGSEQRKARFLFNARLHLQIEWISKTSEMKRRDDNNHKLERILHRVGKTIGFCFVASFQQFHCTIINLVVRPSSKRCLVRGLHVPLMPCRHESFLVRSLSEEFTEFHCACF